MRLALNGALAFTLLLAGGAAATAIDGEVARGVEQVERGDLRGGLETLDAAVRRLSDAPTAGDDFALAHLHMGIAYAGLDQEKAAHASFREALQLRRELTLDPQRFPRRTLRIFEEAQRELPPESGAARAARSVLRLRSGDGHLLGHALVVDTAGHALTLLSKVTTDVVQALLPGGARAEARVVGRDELLDLALLKLEMAPTPLGLDTSGQLQVGQRVTAVVSGRAEGPTADGVVESLDPAGTFFETDLHLERTASGCPLLDVSGNVVGLARVVETAGQSTPTTLAIPASALRVALPQLVLLGHVRRGWLGLELKDVTEEEARHLHLGRALVTAVEPAGPAAAAGFRPGDAVVTLSGRGGFRDSWEVVRAIASLEPGTVASLLVWRPKTKKLVWLKATIGERPPPR